MKAMTRWLVYLGCLALLIGCDSEGDDGDPTPDPDMMESDGGAVDMAPEPEPEPDAAPMPGASLMPAVFRVPSIVPGQTVERSVRLSNTGNVTFEVTGLAVEPGAGFQLLYRQGERPPIIAISFAGQDVGNYPLLVEPGAALEIILEHRPAAEGVMPSGAVTISTSLPEGDISVPIEATEAVGEIAADPEAVVFGRVPPGETAEMTIEVNNTGAAPLTIQAIQLQGDPDFTVTTADGADVDSILADPDGDGEDGLAPGSDFFLTVIYSPVAEGLDEAVLSIVSDALNSPDLRIPLSGNDATGCILVDPPEMLTVQFDEGQTMRTETVSVSNCGGQPLTIDRIRFRPGTPVEAFAFPEGSLPEFPTTLEPGGDALEVQVELSLPLDRIYEGVLQIFSNDPEQPEIVVEIESIPFGGGQKQP